MSQVKDFFTNKKVQLTGLTTAAMMAMPTISALASGGGGSSVDVSGTLATSFQSMADTMLSTITATLPVVMSVMSAYLCINFGIRFFKRFAK